MQLAATLVDGDRYLRYLRHFPDIRDVAINLVLSQIRNGKQMPNAWLIQLYVDLREKALADADDKEKGRVRSRLPSPFKPQPPALLPPSEGYFI